MASLTLGARALAAFAAAVRLARELLAVPGVRGVDLSAVPGPGREDRAARALATIGRALGATGP